MNQIQSCFSNDLGIDQIQCYFMVFIYNSLMDSEINNLIINRLSESKNHLEIEFYINLVYDSKLLYLLNKE